MNGAYLHRSVCVHSDFRGKFASLALLVFTQKKSLMFKFMTSVERITAILLLDVRVT
jgi:hypothetical protein